MDGYDYGPNYEWLPAGYSPSAPDDPLAQALYWAGEGACMPEERRLLLQAIDAGRLPAEALSALIGESLYASWREERARPPHRLRSLPDNPAPRD